MFLIDGHVHIYDCFDMQLFCDSAYENFHRQAIRLNRGDDFCGVLLLAEKAGQKEFRQISASLERGQEIHFGHWKVSLTEEPYTLEITNSKGNTLYLVQGRQLNSREGLEVLALVSADNICDNTPLVDQVKEIRKKRAIPVIPWAFGKWLGKRGGLLKLFIQKEKKHSYFLGDNGGRPFLFPSRLFAEYKKQQRSIILSGSDPLPLENEENRIGSFGIYIDQKPEGNAIGAQIQNLLENANARFICYGKPMPLLKFLRNQYLIRKKQ